VHDHEEAEGVGEERHRPGNEQLEEGFERGGLAVQAIDVACFRTLVIWTAWLTPIEKIRNGTRIDIGSMP